MRQVLVGSRTEEAAIDAEAALEQVFHTRYAAMVRLAVLLLRDRALAEDVVQDAFVALHRRWDRIGEDKVAAYLRRSVVNGGRSALRHRTVVLRHRPDPLPDEPPADHAVLAAERRDRVLAALAGLPTRQREVLALRYWLDLSERDIAATLGISAGSVKAHASRGATALRAALGDIDGRTPGAASDRPPDRARGGAEDRAEDRAQEQP